MTIYEVLMVVDLLVLAYIVHLIRLELLGRYSTPEESDNA